MNKSCHTHEWVLSHIWIGHITHMNESCHTYEWVMSRIWMSHVTHMNGLTRGVVSPRICVGERVDVRTWVGVCMCMCECVWGCACGEERVKESCHTYGWVMSHIWMHFLEESHLLYTVWKRECLCVKDIESESAWERERARAARVCMSVCVWGGESFCVCACACVKGCGREEMSHVTHGNEWCRHVKSCECVVSHI